MKQVYEQWDSDIVKVAASGIELDKATEEPDLAKDAEISDQSVSENKKRKTKKNDINQNKYPIPEPEIKAKTKNEPIEIMTMKEAAIPESTLPSHSPLKQNQKTRTTQNAKLQKIPPIIITGQRSGV